MQVCGMELVHIHIHLYVISHSLSSMIFSFFSFFFCWRVTWDLLNFSLQIEALGIMFPSLEVLILAECPLSKLTEEGQFKENFPNLKYLSLNNTKISSWDSVDRVNWFPNLAELRLQQCPLYEVDILILRDIRSVWHLMCFYITRVKVKTIDDLLAYSLLSLTRTKSADSWQLPGFGRSKD